MKNFETQFENFMMEVCGENPDPSHDILHVQRVVRVAKKLASEERAKLEIVVPAAYLHDCVYISKADPRRKRSSKISADKAIELLREWNYPEDFFVGIHHAILAHSFSAGILAETIEAKVVQDADRLDAMGAVGIFRAFAFSGLVKRPLYNPDDSFCETRAPDDQTNTLDHFFTKLLGLQDKLWTLSAKLEGEKRLSTMTSFLESLKDELNS